MRLVEENCEVIDGPKLSKRETMEQLLLLVFAISVVVALGLQENSVHSWMDPDSQSSVECQAVCASLVGETEEFMSVVLAEEDFLLTPHAAFHKCDEPNQSS